MLASSSKPSLLNLLISLPAGLLVAFGAAGCAPEVPSNPTWAQDVQPILAANCVRCHRSEPQNFAPSSFNLELCDVSNVSGTDVAGASAQVGRVIARAKNDSGAASMPPEPAAALSDRQIEVLENWQNNGAPCSGTGNAAPSFALLRSLDASRLSSNGGDAGSVLALRYQIDDQNGDPVDTDVFAVDQAGTIYPIAEMLGAGVGEVHWSLSGLRSGRYEIIAELDDGFVVHEHSVGVFDY